MSGDKEPRTLIPFGPFGADLHAQELRKQGVRLRLPRQSFQILKMLLEHPGELVTREVLRQELWPSDTFVDFEHGLNAAVNRLREALGDDADSPRYIETLTRRGYRFIAVVETQSYPEAGLIALRPRGQRLALAGVGLVAALSVAIFLALHNFGIGSGAPHPINSLAVLPLENLSPDKEADFYAQGMTDELITELAKLSALRVISRTSVMPYEGVHKPLVEIVRALKVDAVVEGTVARSGKRVRITAQLIQADPERQLWAKSYQRDLTDVLLLQDEVARDIAEEIRIKLTAEDRIRLADARPVDPAVHDAYLRGRYLWSRRSEAEVYKAKDYFEQVIARDPRFAPAHSGLADTYFYLSYGWGHIPPKEGMPLSRAEALKAIDLDGSSAEGHASLGTVKFLYDWDLTGAEQEFKRAIALNANYEWGHHAYSVLLATMRRSDESVAEARKAVEVDPLSVPATNILVSMLECANRWDEAFSVLQNALELDPNPTHLAMFRTKLANHYRRKGMIQEAIEQDLQARAAQGASPQEIANLRQTYARSGQRGVLQGDLEKALKRWEQRPWHYDAFQIAMLYANLGELDQAFVWVDKCIELRSTMLMWIYAGENPINADPRFAEVQRKMGVQN